MKIKLYICIRMVIVRCIFILLLCYAQSYIYAQDGAYIVVGNAYTGTDVDAIIETDAHFLSLKTIENKNDSLKTKWVIKNKKPNSSFTIENHLLFLKDYKTGEKKHSFFPKTTISFIHSEAYQTDTFNIIFPAPKDSIPVFSISLAPTLHIDSITLFYDSISALNSRYLREVRYSVPYANSTLQTKEDSIALSDTLFRQGVHLYKKEAYQEAILCFEKCFAFDKLYCHHSILSRDRSDYSRIWLACAYYKSGQKEKAETIDLDYMLEPFDRTLTERSDSLYNSLKNVWTENVDVLGYKKICEYDSIALGRNSHRYALSLYDLGLAYTSKRLFADAKKHLLHSYDIISKLSEENWLGKSALRELAKISYEEEDYLSAVKYMEQSLGISESFFVDFSNDFPILSDYTTLSNYYIKTGMWDKAIQMEEKRSDYWKKRFLKSPLAKWYYTLALDSYVNALNTSGKYKDAFRVCRKLIDINNSGSNLLKMGWCYYRIRDFQSAIKCYQCAIQDRPSLANSDDLNQIAICYSAMGETDKAIEIQKECLALIKPTTITYSNVYNGYANYTTKLSNLASFFNQNEQYDSALVYEKKSLELKKQFFSQNSENIAYSNMNLGIAYGGKRNYKQAVNYLLRCDEFYKKQRQRKLYQRTLSYLLKYSSCLNDFDNLIKYTSEFMKSAGQDLLFTFQELTYDERSKYIEGYSDLLNRQIPAYAYYTHSDSIIMSAFNASLMMKGALLNSENSVKRVIEESKNDALKDLWAELKADRYILAKSLEKDSLYRKLNTDSLQKVIYRLEDSLIVKCKEYGDITQSMKLKWKDIQNHLHSEDVAIEFLSFPVNNDSIVYTALLLRKGSESPKMITLFEEKQLTGFPDSLHYQSKEMTDLVWKPLQAELEGIKNIYFSPSGALYNIGIEYLPGMENYNIYRLSSTRELVTDLKTGTKKRAVLYGGLKYDAEFDKSVTDRSLAMLDEAFIERPNVRGMGLRGGKEYLKHTKEEVDIIGKELNNANWVCVLDTAAMGTEESFKALSGKNVGCLHISTHGFYYNKEDADNARYKFMLIDNNMISAEDKALTRSGLVMSRANHILEDKVLPDNVEDGILTAKEIADVDLRGLDLVVLSACQTGLGDIAQGEGVFGLQRGFKKAGAKSILMSLWEVDDKATQILMTQFYKNLLSGQSKRQSLLAAQEYLRKVEDGKYDEPKYWAAFILLDGIQ